jgi:hypothetical protein
MLILVALVALVASLSWPSLRRLSQKRELLESARQIRVELLRTRLDAIQSGAPRQFRYQLGTGLFESTTFQPTAFAAGEEDWAGTAELPAESVQEPAAVGSVPEELDPGDGLPLGVVFVDPAASESESALDAAELAETELSDVAEASWSAPVIFYPNGRALNARLRLTNGVYVVDVTLRGLTGTARIGQVRRVIDQDQPLGDELP